MRIKKEELPVVMEAPGSVIRNYKSFGGMTVGFVEFPAGTDFTPLLHVPGLGDFHVADDPAAQ